MDNFDEINILDNAFSSEVLPEARNLESYDVFAFFYNLYAMKGNSIDSYLAITNESPKDSVPVSFEISKGNFHQASDYFGKIVDKSYSNVHIDDLDFKLKELSESYDGSKILVQPKIVDESDFKVYFDLIVPKQALINRDYLSKNS